MKLVTIIASLFLLISFIGCKDKAQVKDAIVAKDITATPAVTGPAPIIPTTDSTKK